METLRGKKPQLQIRGAGATVSAVCDVTRELEAPSLATLLSILRSLR